MKMKWILVLTLLPTIAWASASRTLDGQFISNGANTLTLPAATDTLVGRATTDTLTNKSISGASNTISNLSASSITSGTSSVSVGGTGQNALTIHDTVVGNGTGPVSLIAPGTSGFVYTSNGASADPSFQAPMTAPPVLNSSASSGQSVTSGAPVSLATPSYDNIVWITGSPGSVTNIATPSISITGLATGARVLVVGTDNTNTVTLLDEAALPGSKLQMNGAWVGAKYSSIEFNFDGTYLVEKARR